MSKQIVCHCGFTCSSNRGLSAHWEHNPGCATIENPPKKKHKNNSSSTSFMIRQDSNVEININDDNSSDIDNDSNNYVNFF